MRHLFLVLPLCLIACASEKTDDDDGDGWGGSGFDTGDQGDAADVDGAEVFDTTCAACHGADGSGVTGPDLNEQVPALSDADLLDVIENGTGYMPDLDLSSDEVDAVFRFIRETFGEYGGA